MPMALMFTDLHALNCKNCSQMVNWILVELENDLVFGFFQKKIVLFFPNENQLSFHMMYHLFLHWGFQNLEKDFIPTNMHTTVLVIRKGYFKLYQCYNSSLGIFGWKEFPESQKTKRGSVYVLSIQYKLSCDFLKVELSTEIGNTSKNFQVQTGDSFSIPIDRRRNKHFF
jgi:hypothetical protein